MGGTYKRKEKVDLDMDGNEILNFIPQTVTELPTTNVKKNQVVTKDGMMYICYNPAGTTEVEIWKVFTAMPEGSNVLTDGDIGTRVAKLTDGKVPIDEIPDIGIAKVTGLQAELDGKASTDVATTTKNGLMSKTDFTKLSGIDDGAKKPVENLTSATEPPTAKTVGDELAKYVQKNTDITASTIAKLVTYDAKGLVTGGRAIQKTDLPAGVGYILEGTIATGLTKGEFTLPTDPVIKAYNVQVYDSTGNLVDTFVNITDNKVTVEFNTATTEEHKVRIIGS